MAGKPKFSEKENELIKKHHEKTSRHTIKAELKLNENEKRHAFHIADSARVFSNRLTAWMNNRLKDLFRSKEYRAHLRQYGIIKNRTIVKEEELAYQEYDLECIGELLAQDQKKWHVTEKDLQQYAKKIYPQYNINSVFSQTLAEDVWKGVEKILYSNGKQLHYKKAGKLPVLRAKQCHSAILLKVQYFKNKPRLTVSLKGVCKNAQLILKDDDIFVRQEIRQIKSFMLHPETELDYAKKWKETDIPQDTFRPCYVSLKCEEIRGKLRVYAIITIEGHPMKKLKKDKSARHTRGKGTVGMDLGTQSVAVYAPDKPAILINLGEPYQDYFARVEKKIKRLQRMLDRQRRTNNPEYYNEDGTIKKGKKVWKKSKRMRKTEKALAEEYRKMKWTRTYMHKQTTNKILSMGDVLVTEPSNSAKLAKRSTKPTEIDEKTGKCKRKKRYGASINRRAPGELFALVKKAYGDNFHTVPYPYRASQYDHTNKTYVKKKLSQRTAKLSDGTDIPRDVYSAFLLANADENYEKINQELCVKNYEHLKTATDELIQNIKDKKLHIMNSGI